MTPHVLPPKVTLIGERMGSVEQQGVITQIAVLLITARGPLTVWMKPEDVHEHSSNTTTGTDDGRLLPGDA